MTLTDDLLAANVREFHRPAIEPVWAEYQAFMETGAYPYIDSVVVFVAERAGITLAGPYHEKYVTEPVGKALGHEVYLASGQWRVREMQERERDYVRQGYTREITDLNPTEGFRIEIADIPDPVRCKWFGAEWGLCPPRKRNGFSLKRLVEQHTAYVTAVTEGQTRMNGPRVVMWREAS